MKLTSLSLSIYNKEEVRRYSSVEDAFASMPIVLLIQEFRAWLIEEKMVNREALSKDQEKKLFAQFVEDFNTGTSSSQTLSCSYRRS